MKLIKRTKKGFTIVELVIVIAVIAVLAAVLIPTFINLTNKANKASDESLVTSLNKALAIEEVDHDVNNMHDAVECLKREGYLASALVTKSDQKLLYNLEENRFLLEEDKKEIVPDYKYWTIAKAYDAEKQQYSIYAADDFSTAEIAGLKVGFDAGDSDAISSIAYVGNGEPGQNVVIRTNSVDATLTVNAPYDTVHHYDYLEELNVAAIADASYHEHGTVRTKATIAQGHIVIENEAAVNNIIVPSSAAADSVSIAINNRATVQSVIDYSAGAIKTEETVIPAAVSKVVAEAGKVAYVKSTNANYETFAAAYAATGANDLILLLADAAVDGSSGNTYDVLVNKSIRIDGNGFRMTSSRTASGSQENVSKIFQIENLETTNPINVTLQNIKLNVNAKSNVVIMPNSQYVDLVLENCDFSSSSYPINVRHGAQFINIEIKDGSYIKGYCALNFYGSLSTLKISDSTLHGYNSSTPVPSGDNDYAVIVLDGGTYWGEAAGQNARANIIDIQRSTLIAESAPNSAVESWISFQYGSSQNAQVTVKDSKILDKANGNDKTVEAYFDNANTGDSITMVLTNAQVNGFTAKGYNVTPNSDGTFTVRSLA